MLIFFVDVESSILTVALPRLRLKFPHQLEYKPI